MPIISVTTWDGRDDAQAQELMEEPTGTVRCVTGQHMRGMPVMEAGRGRCSSWWAEHYRLPPKGSAAGYFSMDAFAPSRTPRPWQWRRTR